MCISVDLPDPDGPMIATYSPVVIRSETPRSASTSNAPVRYTLPTSSSSMTGGPAIVAIGAVTAAGLATGTALGQLHGAASAACAAEAAATGEHAARELAAAREPVRVPVRGVVPVPPPIRICGTTILSPAATPDRTCVWPPDEIPVCTVACSVLPFLIRSTYCPPLALRCTAVSARRARR